MHLNRKLLSTLFLTSLLENTQLVSCARIPSRISELTQREANTPLVSLPDFGSISEYVCPTGLTDSWKRQSSGSGITVPKNQLNNLLLQIQLIELQISTLMLAEDGLLPANPSALASPGPTTATSTPLASPSTAANSSLKTTALACSFNASTTTVKVTETVFMTVNVTVAPSSIVQSVAASSTTIVPSSSLALNETTVAVINTSTSVQAASDTSLPGSSAAAPTSNGSIFPEPQTPAAMPTAAAGSPIPAPTSSGPAAASSTPVAASSAPAAASSTAVVGFTGAVPPASNQVSSRYTFNAASSKNIAVYFGQTPVTGGTTLEAQCADPSIDIVILAFVIAQLDGGGLYPAVNFGAACSGQTAKMASEAPGLLSCPDLAANILTCQNTYGKKVFLSIGGAASQISFSSESEAGTFGDVLWNLFGPPGNVEYSELRPFGTVEIDGFDVDNEDNLPSHFDTLGFTLRTHYETASKHYYLSSAPQCPFPDASDPPALLLLCDFVWVQFYNNPPCEIGSAGFDASIKQWSAALEASTLVSKPRLYVGAPAFSEAGVSAYAHIGNAEGMMGIASSVEKMGLNNFGGVMFWDGPEGMLNLEGGKDIISWAKEGLHS